MSPKTLALVAAAVAVMIMGVYLFIQVKASPAQAQSSATVATHTPPPVERATDTPPPSPPIAAPLPTQVTPSAPQIRAGTGASEPQVAPANTDDQRANPRMDSMMELANKAYDGQDFDQAIAIAGKVLSKDPTNVRMLRIMVSANCISGDAAVAQAHYERLPKPPAVDREQMKARCDRYQVTLRD